MDNFVSPFSQWDSHSAISLY